MDSKTIEEKVRETLCLVLNIKQDEIPDDFGELDSLNLLELITQIEEEFGIELNDADVEFKQLGSVPLMVKLIDKKINNKQD